VSVAKRTLSSAIRPAWAGFALVYIAICVFVGVAGSPAIVDERAHYFQIDLFDHGDFRVAYGVLTMLPGYHVVVAAILWLSGMPSLTAARLVNAAFGLAAVAAFHLLRKQAWRDSTSAATLQFALLPILFPFDFLVYTDALSLALVLASGAMTLRGWHRASGLLMLAAMLVRQVNVVWLPLWAWLALAPNLQGLMPSWRESVRRTWPYVLGVVAFMAFWMHNGSISLSIELEPMHPDFSLHVANVYFGLAVFAVLFPLHVTLGVKEFIARVRSRPSLLLVPTLALGMFCWQFRIDHPLNQLLDPLTLHNVVLLYCKAHAWAWAMLGFLAIAGLCSLVTAELKPQGAWMLYPVAALAMAAFWMIEARYALIPVALWLAFRKQRGEPVEVATTAYCAALSVLLCASMFLWHFAP